MTSIYYLILTISLSNGANQAGVIGAYDSEQACLHAAATRTDHTSCVKANEAVAFIDKIAGKTNG